MRLEKNTSTAPTKPAFSSEEAYVKGHLNRAINSLSNDLKAANEPRLVFLMGRPGTMKDSLVALTNEVLSDNDITSRFVIDGDFSVQEGDQIVFQTLPHFSDIVGKNTWQHFNQYYRMALEKGFSPIFLELTNACHNDCFEAAEEVQGQVDELIHTQGNRTADYHLGALRTGGGINPVSLYQNTKTDRRENVANFIFGISSNFNNLETGLEFPN